MSAVRYDTFSGVFDLSNHAENQIMRNMQAWNNHAWQSENGRTK